MEGISRARMVWAKCLLVDSQGALYERFGLCVIALGPVELCQAMEDRSRVRMVWAKRLFADSEGT